MEEDFNLEPVLINEESYSTNLFGEKIVKEKEEVTPLASEVSKEFNIFSLTEVFSQRKKKEAWVLYQKALHAGLSPEEVFYKLFWQVKTLLLADKTKSAVEAGLKPFPYNKAKSALRNFKPGELENISRNLVSGYHRVRRGEGEMETLVERVILSI